MKPESLELAKYRLERAKETLNEFEVLIAANKNNAAANRLYYAVFYAMRAMLATKELDSSKHKGVISFFNKEFVKSNLFLKELASVVKDTYRLRTEGDYSDYVVIDSNELKETNKRVKDFITQAEKVLGSLS